MKICTKCKIEKPLDAFSKATYKKNGVRSYRASCKACMNAQMKEYNATPRGQDARKAWLAANPERRKMHLRKQSWKRLGLDPEEAENYYQSHDGKCEICGLVDSVGRRLAMDHCHTSGKIRGMLCQKCNIALGHFQDSPDLLSKAIEYLKRSNL